MLAEHLQSRSRERERAVRLGPVSPLDVSGQITRTPGRPFNGSNRPVILEAPHGGEGLSVHDRGRDQPGIGTIVILSCRHADNLHAARWSAEVVTRRGRKVDRVGSGSEAREVVSAIDIGDLGEYASHAHQRYGNSLTPFSPRS